MLSIDGPLYRGKVALPRALRESHHLRARYGRVLLHATLMPLARDGSVSRPMSLAGRAGAMGGDAGSLGRVHKRQGSRSRRFGERTMGTWDIAMTGRVADVS
jgi:hypothetical protein